ncbi:MAG: hypothetical protein DELT_02668 [Desulfovibrio sp.]
MKEKLRKIAKAILRRLKQIAIAADQLLNTFIPGGWADETISARCWRLRSRRAWGVARLVIDTVLFFDKNHCEESYNSEKLRTQCAPEYRPASVMEE